MKEWHMINVNQRFLMIIKEYQAHSHNCNERESLTLCNIVKWISSGIIIYSNNIRLYISLPQIKLDFIKLQWDIHIMKINTCGIY